MDKMDLFKSKPVKNDKISDDVAKEAAFWKEFSKQSEDIASIERELTELSKKLARIERKVYRTNLPDEPQADNSNWWKGLPK
jgi:septal ring factor EnvC (AmiA/AmiB activator)